MIADGQLEDSDCWEVLEGESFTFSIKLIDGYHADNIIIRANGTEIANNNGKYTINSVVANVIITAEGIEEDEVTYIFALTFKDDVYVQVWLPESVELTLSKSQIKTEYKADELVLVDTEYNEPYTFEEIIALVNEECSMLQVVGFTIGGLDFIEVDGNNLKVNWNVLKLVGSNCELVVKTKAI
jgi:hydroxymethylpyrimidine pyrophosphatase-like HAD family hydrolase